MAVSLEFLQIIGHNGLNIFSEIQVAGSVEPQEIIKVIDETPKQKTALEIKYQILPWNATLKNFYYQILPWNATLKNFYWSVASSQTEGIRVLRRVWDSPTYVESSNIQIWDNIYFDNLSILGFVTNFEITIEEKYMYAIATLELQNLKIPYDFARDKIEHFEIKLQKNGNLENYKFLIDDIESLENQKTKLILKSKGSLLYEPYSKKEPKIYSFPTANGIIKKICDDLQINFIDNLPEIPMAGDYENNNLTDGEIIEDLCSIIKADYYYFQNKIIFEPKKLIDISYNPIVNINSVNTNSVNVTTNTDKNSLIGTIWLNYEEEAIYCYPTLNLDILPSPQPISPKSTLTFTDTGDANKQYKITPKQSAINLFYSPLTETPQIFGMDLIKNTDYLQIETGNIKDVQTIETLGGIKQIIDCQINPSGGNVVAQAIFTKEDLGTASNLIFVSDLPDSDLTAGNKITVKIETTEEDKPISSFIELVNETFHEDFENLAEINLNWISSPNATITLGTLGAATVGYWNQKNNNTPSGGTGASSAQSGTYYLYTEMSSDGHLETYTLEYFKTFETFKISTLSFYFHLFGTNCGKFEIELKINDIWESKWEINGNQGDQWNLVELDLSQFKNSTNLRFKYSGATGWSSDLCLDNINIITTFYSPTYTLFLGDKPNISSALPIANFSVNTEMMIYYGGVSSIPPPFPTVQLDFEIEFKDPNDSGKTVEIVLIGEDVDIREIKAFSLVDYQIIFSYSTRKIPSGAGTIGYMQEIGSWFKAPDIIEKENDKFKIISATATDSNGITTNYIRFKNYPISSTPATGGIVGENYNQSDLKAIYEFVLTDPNATDILKVLPNTDTSNIAFSAMREKQFEGGKGESQSTTTPPFFIENYNKIVFDEPQTGYYAITYLTDIFQGEISATQEVGEKKIEIILLNSYINYTHEIKAIDYFPLNWMVKINLIKEFGFTTTTAQGQTFGLYKVDSAGAETYIKTIISDNFGELNFALSEYSLYALKQTSKDTMFIKFFANKFTKEWSKNLVEDM